MATHNNTFAAQMNSNQLKRHLLAWLIGLSFVNVFLLLVVILLIVFASALLRRCAVWKSKSQLHHKQLIMKKHNLIESPSSSALGTQVGHSLPTISAGIHTSVSAPTLSYAELSAQLEAQHHLARQLASDLHTTQRLRTTAGSTGLPTIS